MDCKDNGNRNFASHLFSMFMIAFPDTPALLDLPETEISTEIGMLARVILFNDEFHSFDDVISQIVKATGCSYARADSLTQEVHTVGKAMVFDGQFQACLRVSHILEDIDLTTQIEF